jgi:hypothetical protein
MPIHFTWGRWYLVGLDLPKWVLRVGVGTTYYADWGHRLDIDLFRWSFSIGRTLESYPLRLRRYAHES